MSWEEKPSAAAALCRRRVSRSPWVPHMVAPPCPPRSVYVYMYTYGHDALPALSLPLQVPVCYLVYIRGPQVPPQLGAALSPAWGDRAGDPLGGGAGGSRGLGSACPPFPPPRLCVYKVSPPAPGIQVR